ncbi:MAG: DNA topoisomerase VI subunit B [Thermoplasmata archaeon]|nr:MAG: DNA topoisomerase VI subunit B [Thermoplasmata archaeon]
MPGAKPIAETLAKKQKEISIAEFFERNKQILGFDSLTRALITCVKEAVDNALDACEESGILPDIFVKIETMDGDEYKITVEDNGPGIVKSQIPHVFARLLYGSRFHTLKQSRGQQGIGISAAVLYSQLTTGKTTIITSKIGEGFPAHRVELLIDTKKNLPRIVKEEMDHWERRSGTRIEIFVKGKYVKNRKQSVYEYLRSTAIVNPHARIIFIEPDGTETVFERVVEELPEQPREIKPHPYGIELGTLLKMLKETKAKKITSFLSGDFSSISPQKAKEIVRIAEMNGNLNPKEIGLDEAKKLLAASKKVKLVSPPTDCLSPIGETLIKRGLRKETLQLSPEFISTDTRQANVFSGTPFMVESGIVYGGSLPKDGRVELLRFANRVPLLYQEGGCAITEAVKSMDWRRYGLEQKGGKGMPCGPAIILVHVASVNIPFTSESKEAVAHIDEIEKEIRLSLQQCARKMRLHLSKKKKKEKMKSKFLLISQILPEIAKKSAEIVGKPVPPIDGVISQIMNIVWVDDQVVSKNGVAESTITIINYKRSPQRFTLYAEIPDRNIISHIVPEPAEIRDRVIKWNVSLKPTEKMVCSFRVYTDGKDFDENNLYASGIDPVNIVGVEKWEGEE